MKNQYKIRTIRCIGCGKIVTDHFQSNRKYCSLECFRKSKRPNRMTGKNIKCKWCGKEVYKQKCHLNKSKSLFCSPECQIKWQGRNKLVFHCKICGKEFKWSPSRTKDNNYNPTYCSIKCRNDDKEWVRNTCIKANLVQMNKKGLNKLECEGNKILDEIGIDYITQFTIDKFTVDIFIPEYNIVIQWDGDYWHGHPSKKPYDKRQIKRMNLDKSQDKYMRKVGYTVLRFWENEVYKKRNYVKENILMSFNKHLFSSEYPDWETPKEFFDKLDREFHFTVDICATKESAKCDIYFTPEHNALLLEWKGIIFMNPLTVEK